MRTVSGTITTAEQGTVLAPRHAMTAERRILSFSAPSTQSNASLDTDIAPNVLPHASNASIAYATFMYADGSLYAKVMGVGTASDWAFTSTNATLIDNSGTFHPMRAGMVNESGTTYVYSARSESAQVRLRRSTISATSNPPSLSFSTFGPLFGPQLVETLTQITRVESVMPLTGGNVIVAIGEHNYAREISTITFYWVTTSAVVQLNAIIQYPNTDAIDDWWTVNKNTTYHCATSTGTRFIVASNTGTLANPNAVAFTVETGIDSTLYPVVPSDPESAALGILPANMTLINSRVYLTGRVIRRAAAENGSGSTIDYDGYMVSNGDQYFSFGARNHFIQTAKALGSMFVGGSTVYYGGNLNISSATGTRNELSSYSDTTTLTSNLMGWRLGQVADAADTLSVGLANNAGQLASETRIQAGGVVRLQSGQEGTLADIGEYGVDTVKYENTPEGRGEVVLQSRSYGHKLLLDWVSPLYGQINARTAIKTTLNKLAGLILKTPEGEHLVGGANGATYTGLNDPVIMFSEGFSHPDELQKATVRFGVTEASGTNYHLSTFGFLIGNSDAGEGHVFVIPKASGWTGYSITAPTMRRLTLPAVDPNEPEAEDTGFNLVTRKNGLVTGIDSNRVRTVAVSSSYRTQNTFSAAANTTYDFAVRTSGRRAQLYTRTRNYAPASAATNAHYTLQTEFLFNNADRKIYGEGANAGITLETDVYGDTSAFAQSAYDDIEQTLTDANNYAELAEYGANAWSVTTSGGANINGATPPTGMVIGGWIRVIVPSYSDQLHQVLNIVGNNVTLASNFTGSVPNGTNATAYTINAADVWGYASCGKKNLRATEADELGELPIYIDPMAVKRPRAIWGRALFVTDDGTAASARYVSGDGVWFGLRSGSADTLIAWDDTNPTPEPPAGSVSWITDRYSGSSPSVWRIIFHHGYIFGSASSTYGLPTSGYMKVEGEVLRYLQASFYRRGMLSQDTWCIVPAYYAPLAAAGAGSTTLRNWRSTGGAQPGDDLGQVPNAVGMLVEVSSRNNEKAQSDKQYYVTAQTYVGSPSVGSTSNITLNQAYENSVSAANTDTSTLPEANTYGDIAILSGRGQFATEKTTHAADTPVVYYPCDASGVGADILVNRYHHYGGNYVSVKDALLRACRLAGVNPSFRSAHTDPTTSQTFSIGTSATTLLARENLSDFVLEANLHVPGNSTNSGGITNANRLIIGFRAYYLVIQGYNTAAQINSFIQGHIRVGLILNSGEVTPDGNGDRWLESATIPVTDTSISGTYSGTTPNFTLTENNTLNVNLLLAVVGDEVIVEINGQHLWTFDLPSQTDGSNTYAYYNAAPITIAYSTAVSGNSCTATLIELSDEAGSLVVRKGSGGGELVDDVISERNIRHRATQAGGIEFSQHWTRDNAGTLRYNLLKDSWGSADLSVFAHQEVVGDSSAEYMDETTLRNEGYSFNSISSSQAKTAELAREEARLYVRQSKELASQRDVSGFGRIALQPEDRIALVYNPSAGDVPAVTSEDFVITQVSLDADNKSVKGDYVLRKYIAV